MKINVRKLVLTSHITSAVGLLGAVAAFLTLAVAGLVSRDPQIVHAAYPAMKLVAWLVIVPLAFASLLIGASQSLLTNWGLVRHYWVVAKLVLTVVAIAVLLAQMNTIGLLADAAGGSKLMAGELRGMQVRLLIHGSGGLFVLVLATVLAVFKPEGLTPWARNRAV